MTPMGGLEGAGAIAVMAGIDQGVKSGLFRTMSAVSKARLADAMASGNMQTALDLLTRAGAAGASQVPQSKYSLENMMQAVRQQQ
jgi:Arc/MetJ-type ribon-helix-helix transcriptional regulator